MCGIHVCFAEIWCLLGCDAGLSGVLPAALKEHSAFNFTGWGGQKNAICHCLAVALYRALTICRLLSRLLTTWSSALTADLIMAPFWFAPPTHACTHTELFLQLASHYLLVCPSWTNRPTWVHLPCMEFFFEPSTSEGESITSHWDVAKHYLSRTPSHTRRPESSECRLFSIVGYQCS